MNIRINVTKDILQRSMMYGTKQEMSAVPENCAVALAVREIAPNARIGILSIVWLGIGEIISYMPAEATAFIKKFDRLSSIPEARLEMEPISFEVDFPDSLVEKVGLDEITTILSKSESLQLA